MQVFKKTFKWRRSLLTSDKYAKSKKSLLIETKEIYHKQSCKQNIDILNQYPQGPGLSEK